MKLLKIEIIDNGSGFELDDIVNNKKAHKSMGIQIIKQRIDLINQKLNKKIFKLEFVEMEKGTKVKLLLPILT